MGTDVERGQRLKEERKRLGLTQSDAARIAGVSREMFSRYEAGANPGREPSAKLLGHGFDFGYVLSGRRKEDFRPLAPTHFDVKTGDGNVRRLPLPPKKNLSWREALEMVLDVLHENSKTLPGGSVTAIVDAIMAWQRAGASVNKSTIEAQLKAAK